MEIEKHLFRISEKSYKAENAPLCWKIIFIVSLVLASVNIIALAIGQFVIKPKFHMLQKCLTSHNFVLKSDDIGLIFKEGSAEKVISDNKPINTTNIEYCKIYKNLNTTDINDDNQLLLSGMLATYRMQEKQRELLKFDNYTFVFVNRPTFLEFVYTTSSLFGNEIIKIGENKKFGLITQSNELFIKSPSLRFSYHVDTDQMFSIWGRLIRLVQIIFTYAIASIITSLYIYITIIASPAVILLFLKLTPYGRTQVFFQAFKAFPWIGMHSIIFRSSSKQQVRKSFAAICFSLVYYFIIMYLGYYTIVVEISNIFFQQAMESGVGEILFGYFALVQFAALVFMRTRPFLKYFPVINMLVVFFFMIYCKFSPLGFKMLGVFAMNFFGTALFAYMVLTLEIEAQRNWQPGTGYTPSINQPRAGLLGAFSLNWINALPDEWTMLMPLMSREHFTNKELAFVEQNYEILGQYLNQQ